MKKINPQNFRSLYCQAFYLRKVSCFMVLFTLYASISSAQDTILTNILNFENPIREIVKDGNENIYVQTLEGVFLLKGNSFEKIDFKISNFDGIVVYNKKLTTRRTLEKKNIFFVREKPNCDWQTLIPKSGTLNFCRAVKDQNGQVIFSNGSKFLFCFKINNQFKRSLPNLSIRGIQIVDNNRFVLTYSGLNLNGVKWNDQISNSSSNFSKAGSFLYFASTDQVFRVNLNQMEIEVISNKSKSLPMGEISSILYHDSILYIGGFKGLFYMDRSGPLQKTNLAEEINQIHFSGDKIMVCTIKGIYEVKDRAIIQRIEFQENTIYNDIRIYQDNIYVSTSNGIWMLEKGKTKAIKLLKNTPFENIECYTLEIDDYNQLWIGTASGLLRYNTDNASINVYLSDVEFNKRSSYKYQSKLFFGSTEGLFEFDMYNFPPEEIYLVGNSIVSKGWFQSFKGILLFGICLIIFLGIILFFKYKRNNNINNKYNTIQENQHLKEKVPFTMDNIEVYILENMGTITAERLREDSGLSKNTFYKLFSQHYDITPKQLIETIRRDYLKRRRKNL